MKKLIIGFASFFLMVGMINAQVDGVKLYKKAKRSLGSYNLDQVGNLDKLAEAKNLIDEAISTGTLDSDIRVFLVKGQI